jgi:hypothetical protein
MQQDLRLGKHTLEQPDDKVDPSSTREALE